METKWQRVLRNQEEGDSLGSGAGNPPSGDPPNPNPNPQSGSSPTGTDSGSQTPFTFRNPKLAGKSPEEIEQIFSVQEAAIREQGQRLNQLSREGETRTTPQSTQPVQPTQPVEEVVDPADYWKDPIAFQKKERKRIVEEIRGELKEIIAPFQQDLIRQREAQAWLDARAQFADFSTYEPLIREMMGKMGVQSPDSGTLATLYYTAVGYMAKQGNNGNQPTSQAPGNGNSHRPAPPQHQPSNQPLRQPESGKKYRELTENERTLARMRGMTAEQYLDELENEYLELS